MGSDKFRDKLYVVTGCSRGIGKYIVYELIRRGALVHGIARSGSALEEMKVRFGEDKFTYTICNLAESSCLERIVSNVTSKSIPIYGLINNAGMGAMGNPLELGYNVYEYLTRLLYLAPVRLCIEFGKIMTARGEGVIVNVITLAIITHIRGLEVYVAPKHALHRFTEDLRKYLKPHGILVVSVYPSLIETDFFKVKELERLYDKFRRNVFTRITISKPEKVAKAIVDAIEKGKERVFIPWFTYLARFKL